MAAHFCVGYPCPLCSPWWPAPSSPPAPVYTCSPGCICPPTSEKTCESPICPRKNHLSASGRGFVGSIEKVADVDPALGKATA